METDRSIYKMDEMFRILSNKLYDDLFNKKEFNDKGITINDEELDIEILYSLSEEELFN